MDLVESMAIDYPLCAKTLALDTAQKDMQKKIHKEKTGTELGVSCEFLIDCSADILPVY